MREAEESEVRAKRERVGDEDGEEMDIDDDDEAPPAPSTSNSMSYSFTVLNYRAILQPLVQPVHSAPVQPSNKLSCSNLPQEVTNGVLAVLFQQYVVMC